MFTPPTIATNTELRALNALEIDSVSGGTALGQTPFSVPNLNPVNRYAFGPLLGAIRTIKLG